MAIAKVIEINVASNKGLEDAIASGIAKAGETVRNIHGAWVNEQQVTEGREDRGSTGSIARSPSFSIETWMGRFQRAPRHRARREERRWAT